MGKLRISAISSQNTSPFPLLDIHGYNAVAPRRHHPWHDDATTTTATTTPPVTLRRHLRPVTFLPAHPFPIRAPPVVPTHPLCRKPDLFTLPRLPSLFARRHPSRFIPTRAVCSIWPTHPSCRLVVSPPGRAISPTHTHTLAPSGPPALVHLSSCRPLTWSCRHQRQRQRSRQPTRHAPK